MKLWCCVLIVAVSLSELMVAQDDDDFNDIDSEDFDDVPQTHYHDHDDDGSFEARKSLERPWYKKPTVTGNLYFAETFESEADFSHRWIASQAKKDHGDDALAKYDGQWNVEEPQERTIMGDLGLVLKSKAKHHAVSAKLDTTFDFTASSFVVQYEVKFQNGQECGGAYLKLLSADDNLDLNSFYDKTAYTVMFGPDKCGNDYKLHFIFRHKNPVTGRFEEKHAKQPTQKLDQFFTDKKSHLYTLAVHSDNSFEIYVDQNLVNSGSLLEDMSPPVNPPKEIADVNDKKPSDWDERERIPDPDAVKPASWDETEPEMIADKSVEKPEGWLDEEPELVPDPSSERPEDWDDDIDGDWEPPMINNPKCESVPGCGEWVPPKVKNPNYKGKWSAPVINNPHYKGKWSPRMIPNPNYFEDKHPYKMMPISALGFELWSVSDDILFDNIIITDEKRVAEDWAEQSWVIKRDQELAAAASARSVVDAIMDVTRERPWLWVIIAIVVIAPLFMCVIYCCVPPSQDETAVRKKTDVPSAASMDGVDKTGNVSNTANNGIKTSTLSSSATDSGISQRKGRGKSILNADDDVSAKADTSERNAGETDDIDH